MSNSAFDQYRPHPWHGLSPGVDPPSRLQAFIEITPLDGVKYEIDKVTGYLKVVRPQRTSSLPPSLYGFVPQTLCGRRVAQIAQQPVGEGDGDPLDICVWSERPIIKSEIVLDVRVVGGLRTLDMGQADDKIIAVLEGDPIWGEAQTIEDLPSALLDRLKHYFTTYKLEPGQSAPVQVQETYGVEHAYRVVEAALEDYREMFGTSD